MPPMPPDSAAPRHARITRALHWLTVILVLSTIPAGLVMVQEGLPRPLQDSLFLWHKNIGPVILILVILRIAARQVYPPPPEPASLPRILVVASATVHWLLYLCLVVMAVSGIVRVQAGGYPIELWDGLIGGMIGKDEALAKTAMAVHAQVRIVLIVLILGHAGAATVHGLVLRDGIFRRMWPPV
ncbi:cytochrome b [Poseidonocella sp. HB161398]|uniref:cytochrome b n=1 Tax=Poseidonocella sp. HB161398 TaxID=2320855 RepID=UPI001F118219|nr:cytochrome b/b6 domain-containing protein [Poseidonocella sp. HB161398]